jgi:hypothetical protein
MQEEKLEAKAIGHCQRLMASLPACLSRVGVSSEPDHSVVELSSQDRFVILASDGVWEFITSKEAVDIVMQFDSAEEACRQVSLSACLETQLTSLSLQVAFVGASATCGILTIHPVRVFLGRDLHEKDPSFGEVLLLHWFTNLKGPIFHHFLITATISFPTCVLAAGGRGVPAVAGGGGRRC